MPLPLTSRWSTAFSKPWWRRLQKRVEHSPTSKTKQGKHEEEGDSAVEQTDKSKLWKHEERCNHLPPSGWWHLRRLACQVLYYRTGWKVLNIMPTMKSVNILCQILCQRWKVLNITRTHFRRAPTFVSLSLRNTWNKYQFAGGTLHYTFWHYLELFESFDFLKDGCKERASYDLSVWSKNPAGKASLGGGTRKLADTVRAHSENQC